MRLVLRPLNGKVNKTVLALESQKATCQLLYSPLQSLVELLSTVLQISEDFLKEVLAQLRLEVQVGMKQVKKHGGEELKGKRDQHTSKIKALLPGKLMGGKLRVQALHSLKHFITAASTLSGRITLSVVRLLLITTNCCRENDADHGRAATKPKKRWAVGFVLRETVSSERSCEGSGICAARWRSWRTRPAGAVGGRGLERAAEARSREPAPPGRSSLRHHRPRRRRLCPGRKRVNPDPGGGRLARRGAVRPGVESGERRPGPTRLARGEWELRINPGQGPSAECACAVSPGPLVLLTDPGAIAGPAGSLTGCEKQTRVFGPGPLDYRSYEHITYWQRGSHLQKKVMKNELRYYQVVIFC
ncbi:PREDICTED: uncharacterized protein LOC106147936 [Chinchilla lanigera]|uniref:uncharacterized protein LOC106147936 n=1 Tax=Chinchilla lanigera TaxID=34839 RepID=UPI000696A7B6|nr:PREDICTED: uncharacterized protein LOC106147936 [Chinchilla lanigera]